ncbi:hypothetical protein WAF17_14945 [Bernardetia sp. ABR2-2B]|uniref:hypothetical protein n=1 Tax=Bernardetia sp. ABR2-2B TaxID=3127472 RepID=UPI0030CF0EB9
MKTSKKQIRDRIIEEKYKAFQDLKQIELRLMETHKKDFEKWIALNEYFEELEKTEYELIHEDIEEEQDAELRTLFEMTTKQIIDMSSRDIFHTVFTDYLEKEVQNSVEKFLNNKGLMGVMIHLREYMDVASKELTLKMFKEHDKWVSKDPKKDSFQEMRTFLKMRKQIEILSQNRLDEITEEFVNSLDNKTLKEAALSVQLSESLIKTTMEFVFNRIEAKLNVIMEEYKTVSTILQENIKKKIMEKE